MELIRYKSGKIYKKNLKRPYKLPVSIIAFLLTVYLSLLIFPEILFQHEFKYKSFKIYSHQPFPRNTIQILEQAENLIRSSELHEYPIEQKIFICSNFTEYVFFSPVAAKAFAVNHTFTGNIFIAKADFNTNKSYRQDLINAKRSLSGVIAHETTHSLLFIQTGFLENTLLETWKKEGYCDFIANESTLSNAEGMKLFCSNTPAENNTYNYFKYRLLVSYLLNVKKYSIHKILDSNFNLAALTIETKSKLCQ